MLIRLVFTEIQPFENVKIYKEMYGNPDAVRHVSIRVVSESDDRGFVFHEYDLRPKWTTRTLNQRITISEKRRVAKLSKERENLHLKTDSYYFECDWLI